MNTKPILIVAGEPYSIFSEIFFKSLNKIKYKRPIILIASKELIEKQMKKLEYKFILNEVSRDLSEKILFIPIIGTFTCALIDFISLTPFALIAVAPPCTAETAIADMNSGP